MFVLQQTKFHAQWKQLSIAVLINSAQPVRWAVLAPTFIVNETVEQLGVNKQARAHCVQDFLIGMKHCSFFYHSKLNITNGKTNIQIKTRAKIYTVKMCAIASSDSHRYS